MARGAVGSRRAVSTAVAHRRSSTPAGQAGIPVDTFGGPTVDPTTNVLNLVEAANRRQDDLRAASERYAKDLSDLREKYQEKLADAESKRVDANALAESRRIDALLAAGQNAVALAAIEGKNTASALAERVEASAKALAQGSGRETGVSLGVKAVIGFVSLFVALATLAGAGLGLYILLHK
jgi:hypothetical protein